MRNKLPIFILVALIIGYVFLEVLGPKADDWSPNYGLDRTEPFGSQLLHEGMEDLFPGQDILTVEESPAERLKEFQKERSNYMIIQQVLKVESDDARSLLRYVENGNNVFIAAVSLEGALGDSLGMNSDSFWDKIFDQEVISKDNYVYMDDDFDPTEKHYPLLDNVVYNSFLAYNADKILSRNRDNDAIYVRIDKGEGSFYIHSIPYMFTNYFMVDPVNHEYISKVLSFLPERTTYWDEYYKPGRVHVDTPVSFILDQRSLRWSWFLLLATVVLFIIFHGKRRQRVIPVVEPPVNDTLEFTRTVGRLYYLHGDHKDIAEKKIKFLLEYIRNRWQLSTGELDDEFRRRLAGKSGAKRPLVDNLFNTIDFVRKSSKIGEENLSLLHRMMDDFYNQSR